MNKRLFLAGLLSATLLLSSCNGVPTLPPLDSTIVIEYPRETSPPSLTPTKSSVAHRTSAPPSPTASPVPADTATEEVTETPKPSATDLPPTETPEPSPTSTLTSSSTVQPTFTPTYTPTERPTNTPEPTLTPTYTPTHTFTPTPSLTFTATPFPYGFQDGSPYYLGNFAHPEDGCGWMGVAGQVFDQEGNVIKDVVVKAGGRLDGEPILDSLSMPGAMKVYGPGGYEIVLSHSPVASDGDVWVQLFDLNAHPVSEKNFLTTYDSCQKNLMLLNFIRK